MKTLPTLREKKRYIAFEINSENTIKQAGTGQGDLKFNNISIR